MIESLGIRLQAHKNTAIEAKKTFEEAKKYIEANYNGGLKNQKLAEAKQIFEDTLAQSRENNANACNEVLEGIAETARNIVAEETPTGFSGVCEALEHITDMTKEEKSVYIAKYNDNYLAYRAINNIFYKNVVVITIENILGVIDNLKQEMQKAFYSLSVEGYSYNVLLEGSAMAHCDDILTAFCNRDFATANRVYTEASPYNEGGNSAVDSINPDLGMKERLN